MRNNSNNKFNSRSGRGSSDKEPRYTSKSRNFKKKSGSSRPSKFDETSEKESVPGAAYNDASWYVQSPAQAAAAANLSFGQATGDKFNLVDNTVDPFINTHFRGLSNPGFMAIRTMSTPGIAIAPTDPANLAAQDIYSYVRHANAGHANYDPQDLMLYLLAMDEMYTMYAWLKRAYGVARNYSSFNRYYPRAVLEAMNFDAADFQQNLANYHYFLLIVESMLRKFNVPTGLPYFTKHQWMYSNMYIDAVNVKAQTYFYTPSGYRTYKEMDGTKAGYLKYTEIPSSKRFKYTDITALMYGMLDALSRSEDIGIMSGDIAKAYSSLFSVPETPIDYQVLPGYNEEVLQQFHNATILDTWYQAVLGSNANTLDITQDPSEILLYFNPMASDITIGKEKEILCGNRMLDMQQDIPSPNDVIVATRLTSILNDNGSLVTIDSCGSEIAVEAIIGYNQLEGETWTTKVNRGFGYTYTSVTGLSGLSLLISLYSAFSWRPMSNIIGNPTDPETGFAIRLFNVNNYTTVNKVELEKMHRLSLLGLFRTGTQVQLK